MKKFLFFAVLLMGILSACGDGKNASAKNPRISIIAPMTGPAAVYGEWIQRGIQTAVARGATNVQFEFLDSAGDPKTAVTLAQKALSRDETIALWVASSADTMAVRDLATQARVPLVTSSATSPDITDGRTGVFRTIVNSAQETEALVGFSVKHVRPTKVAVLYINDAGGKASLQQFKNAFHKANVSIVFEDSFERSPQDVRVLSQKALSTNPDVVVVTGYSAAMGQVIKGLRDRSVTIPILCNQGLESPENLSLPGSVLDRIYYSVAYVNVEAVPPEVAAAFQKSYGKGPSLYEITAYDTAMLLSHAVTGGVAKKAELYKALRGIRFVGANGVYQFTDKGNVRKEVAIKEITKGTVSIKEVYRPSSE